MRELMSVTIYKVSQKSMARDGEVMALKAGGEYYYYFDKCT